MSKVNKDDIDKFYDYGIEITTRTIYMGSVESNGDDMETGTDHFMAERIIKGLHILDSQAPTGDKPITILMNNPGGDEIHGMGIFDAIRACKNHVVIKVFGHAMSMGSIILQAADDRIISPNSKLLLHYGTAEPPANAKDAYRWIDFYKKFDKFMEDLYLEKMKEKDSSWTRAKLQNKMSTDWIIDAQEAVELGLADGIIGEQDEQ